MTRGRMAAGTLVLLFLLTACLPADPSDPRIEGMTATQQLQELRSRPSIDEAVATSERLAADALVRFERIGLRPWTRDPPFTDKEAGHCGDFRKLTLRQARREQLGWRLPQAIESDQWSSALNAVKDVARQAGFVEWPDRMLTDREVTAYYSRHRRSPGGR
ncbi:LppA family lipoprotein [Amycolatopsis sp. NPDC101161]|uniref:LppA family lipoprotein n=1 Tax=Amycolatopsis sp. NPDC101161 TaxID=3363940 RepID=UPI00382730EC